MILVNDIYLDSSDRINTQENGDLSITRFNRFSWIGQLRLIDFLSGDVSGSQPPQPYLTQKNKDWLSFLITAKPDQVVGGKISKPSDYYQWDNGFVIGSKQQADCDDEEEEQVSGCNTPITMLDGQQFHIRCNTYISELKPDNNKPICKMVGDSFQFMPEDLGSVTIEYVRYPVRAVLGVKKDPDFNEDVYDPATSVNFEWPEFARELLVWFIVDQFSNRTREQALKQFNTFTGKTARDAK